MTTTTLRAALAASCLGLLAGCTTTSLETKAQLPPPLLEQLPVRVGIHYSEEFSKYVHKETRGSIDYEVNLGPAHVTNLDWLLKAMFREIVHVDDPTRVGAISPPLAFVLEPKFEEYSFLTPKDVAGEAFIVTIRYLLTVYDGSGARVDSFTFTGIRPREGPHAREQGAARDRDPARDARRRGQGGRRADRPGLGATPAARRGQPAAGVAAGAARGAAGAVGSSRARRARARPRPVKTSRRKRSRRKTSRRKSRRPRRRRPRNSRRRQVPEGGFAAPAAAQPRVRAWWRSAAQSAGAFSGSYSWYHSLVKETPAVDTAWPSAKRGL